jgi:hypothetical protein
MTLPSVTMCWRSRWWRGAGTTAVVLIAVSIARVDGQSAPAALARAAAPAPAAVVTQYCVT